MKKLKIISAAVAAALILQGGLCAFADTMENYIYASTGEQVVATEYADADLLTPLEASTVPAGEIGNINAKSAVLMEISTGKVLYEQNPHERLAPASITKIMSLLLVMEAIDAGQFTVDTVVTASDYACSMGGSQIWLEPGETMTVHELLKAAAVASANDATVALAELVSGTETAFVAKMNERAGQLGMNDTTFVNASGLDADGHLTSAYDIALASCELLQHDLIKNYSTIWMDSLRDGQSELVNTNKLVKFYEGATGLKTGTTSTAGHCLSASAAREGMEIVAVVLGCESSKDRFNSARQLLDYGFANWSRTEVDGMDAEQTPVKITKGSKDSVNVKSGMPLSLLVGKGQADKIEKQVTLPECLEAPVYENQQIGEIILTLEGEEVGRIPLTAAENVEKLDIFAALARLLSSLFAL